MLVPDLMKLACAKLQRRNGVGANQGALNVDGGDHTSLLVTTMEVEE